MVPIALSYTSQRVLASKGQDPR